MRETLFVGRGRNSHEVEWLSQLTGHSSFVDLQGVLEGVNLQLKQGKILALTGVSGSGKSTLAALLSRLYEPSSGCVMLDGVDVTSLNPSWLRQQVS